MASSLPEGGEVEPMTMDQIGEILLEMYEPLLQAYLIPSHLLPHIPDMLCSDRDRICKMERQGLRNEAVKFFLKNLKKVIGLGWYQMLRDSLKNAGFEYTLKVLDGNNRIDIKHQALLKRLIAVFTPNLVLIKPSHLIPYLYSKSCINEPAKEEISKAEKNESNLCALMMLLDRVSMMNEDWFSIFIEALIQAKHEDIADKIMESEKNSDKTREQRVQNITMANDPLSNVRAASATPQSPSAAISHVDHFTGEPSQGQLLQSPNISQSELLSEELSLQREEPEGGEGDGQTSEGSAVSTTVDTRNISRSSQSQDNNTESESQDNITDDAKVESVDDYIDSEDEQFYSLDNSDITQSSQEGDKKTLVLRGYQNELAHPALEGKNVIVEAPTGSGKTHVALKIALDHMENAIAPGEQKVIFFVPTVSLVQQQVGMFKTYLSKYRTIGLSGDQKDSEKATLGLLLPCYDIFVCTPQILVDSLSSSDNISSVCEFSLMIFDECHHANKNHPYNQIMIAYMETKMAGDAPGTLPQVIGLTASVGTGKSKTVEATREHILQLCANLDADYIKTVEEEQNVVELARHHNKPDEGVLEVKGRRLDPFLKEISKLMMKIETKMKQAQDTGDNREEIPDIVSFTDLLSRCPAERGCDRYTQWLSSLHKPVAKIHDQKLRRLYVACKEHLKVYNDALIINADCRTKDAVEYLEDQLPQLKLTYKNEIDAWLELLYKEKVGSLKGIIGNELYNNPKLEALKTKILMEYEKEPDSRGILFAKTRALTLALQHWMKETPGLKELNPERLTGVQAPVERGGMTFSKLTDVLRYFKDGKHKIIIATSVAEEGLDIRKCNIVIRYLHVTNEISRVQTMGRARAEEATYMVITAEDSGAASKEEVNKLRQCLVVAAMKQIRRLSNEEFTLRIKRKQKDDKMERDMAKLGKIKSRALSEDEFQLRCYKCDMLACFSSDFRKIEESHHVVIDEDFEKRIKVEEHRNPISFGKLNLFEKTGKVFCGNCGYDWGIMAKYKKVPFPVLKLVSFVLIDERDQRSVCKKWKDAPFSVSTLELEDMQNRMRNMNLEED